MEQLEDIADLAPPGTSHHPDATKWRAIVVKSQWIHQDTASSLPLAVKDDEKVVRIREGERGFLVDRKVHPQTGKAWIRALFKRSGISFKSKSELFQRES